MRGKSVVVVGHHHDNEDFRNKTYLIAFALAVVIVALVSLALVLCGHNRNENMSDNREASRMRVLVCQQELFVGRGCNMLRTFSFLPFPLPES